ncbi:hypothetical protein Acr_08g0013200 [Actinidia rufa]|uniref:Uncharacterized protein n=1 Tax=Actinidia rufa TaxID=165716 RepID=A0A7J0F2K6_9ERIC|nr:hypothetical protein Acr_08g0013200 [Actinidia rufa]
MSARRRPWRDCLPPPSHHPWPIGAPARPVDGSQSKEEAFRSQIDPHRCRIEPRQIGASFRRAFEKEAPIRGSQGDSPPLCKIPATKLQKQSPLQFHPTAIVQILKLLFLYMGMPQNKRKRNFDVKLKLGSLPNGIPEDGILSNELRTGRTENLNVSRFAIEETYSGVTFPLCDLELGEDDDWRSKRLSPPSGLLLYRSCNAEAERAICHRGSDNSKHAHEKTKDKINNKEHRKTKDSKYLGLLISYLLQATGNNELMLHHETAEAVSSPVSSNGDRPDSEIAVSIHGDALKQEEEELTLKMDVPTDKAAQRTGNTAAHNHTKVMQARRRPWRDCLPLPSHHPWPIGAPARPVEGHRAKRKPFEVKSTLIGVESSLVRSVSKQISHSHSPRRRLTIGSAFFRRDRGEFSDEIGASFRQASEKEASIRGSQGDSPPLCKIPATKVQRGRFRVVEHLSFSYLDNDLLSSSIPKWIVGCIVRNYMYHLLPSYGGRGPTVCLEYCLRANPYPSKPYNGKGVTLYLYLAWSFFKAGNSTFFAFQVPLTLDDSTH